MLLRNYDSCEQGKKWDGQNGRNYNRNVNGGYSGAYVSRRWLLEWWNNGTYRKLLTRIQGLDSRINWNWCQASAASEGSATSLILCVEFSDTLPVLMREKKMQFSFIMLVWTGNVMVCSCLAMFSFILCMTWKLYMKQDQLIIIIQCPFIWKGNIQMTYNVNPVQLFSLE